MDKWQSIENEIRFHRRHVFNELTGDYHHEEILRLKQSPMLIAEWTRHTREMEWQRSEALLRRWN